MDHKKRWLVRLVALLPALLLLVAAEFGLRWYSTYRIESRVEKDQFWKASVVIHRRSADATLVYELVPGAEAVREGVPVKINAAGFRDDEFPEKVETGRKRILLLGDSIAWGWGVRMARAFPQLLEALLGEPEAASSGAPPIVYNLGVDGYSTERSGHVRRRAGQVLHANRAVRAPAPGA